MTSSLAEQEQQETRAETRFESSLRVMHVLEATLGGTLRYLENVTSALRLSPISFGFAYATRRADHRLEPMLDQIRTLGGKLYPIDMRRDIHPRSDVAATYTLAGAIRDFKPAIVHCHSSKAGALGRIASYGARPRPRVVYSPHALAPERRYLRIERTFRHLTHRFLAVSESERQQLIDLGFGSKETIGVVYPTIDTASFKPRDQQRERTLLQLPDVPLLLAIGRMTRQKRPLDLLDILQKVRGEVPSACAVWVGDGEQRVSFESRAREMGLTDAVKVTGWIKDVRPYIAAADLLVSTSAFESFGYNVAEALAMERPVVATRVCGTTDILSSQLADHLFETGDTASAAGKCLDILRTPASSRQLARHGREVISSRFSPDRMRESLLRFYFETMAPEVLGAWLQGNLASEAFPLSFTS